MSTYTSPALIGEGLTAIMAPHSGMQEADYARTPNMTTGQQPHHGAEAGSYFDPQPVKDEPMPEDAARPPPVSRRTTPMRPAAWTPPSQRRPTFLRGMRKRATTGLRRQENDPDRSYTFDALSSDSSDSSSDEDEDAQRPRKAPKRSVTGPAGTLSKERTGTESSLEDAQRDEEARKEGRSMSRFTIRNDHFKSKGRISRRDGRLNISVNETANSGYMAKVLGQRIKDHLDIPKRHKKPENAIAEGDEEAENQEGKEREADDTARSIAASLQANAAPRPKLNIVIMVIGSRGDIQPFLRIGKILKEQHGHRVRIASHPTFRDFVRKENELEFFSVGGDPAELMAFMVKNPGLVPNLKTIRANEIQRRRSAMAVMFEGFWRSCIEPTDGEQNDWHATGPDGEVQESFIADAIIANPPSMAHVHVAEKLGIPLHMMFTFPYSPTQQFPHPLANIRAGKSNVDADYVNFMSYGLVEMVTWRGLGDIVNRFREQTLGLEPVSSLWAPGALYRMKVPYTYLWSPSLIPKPKDWGPEIDIAGFVFLDLASNFKPPQDLQDFLDAGDQPVYIGFGSIVVDDPNALTQMIFEATKRAGVRALVNKGWGGFGQSNEDTPDHIFMLGNTPHDWLFPRVKAVVHHGGAGTTAIGLKCAKPTMIVPFFGDQPFWGAMVARAKAGAHQCVPYKNMDVDKFVKGIQQCLEPEAQENVQRIADQMAKEGDGAENAVKSFHRSLPLAGRHNMRCSILEDRVAVWHLRRSKLRLSALAAQLLHEQGKIKWGDVKLQRHCKWNDFDGPGEPITGSVGAITDSLYGIGEGMGMVPVRIAKHIRKHEKHQRKKQEIMQRKEERRRRKEIKAQNAEAERRDEGDGIRALESNEASGDTGSASARPPLGRDQTDETLGSALSAEPTEDLGDQIADDIGAGLKRAGGALLTMPNDLHVAVAQGFHNAPRLWGDATVRKPVHIDGLRSGCIAARKEFQYGIWDGWTGLVKQPMGEWKDATSMPARIASLPVGIGKGLGGFVMKNINAIIAPPAYFSKGVVRYVEKKIEGPGVRAMVQHARISEGERQVAAFRKPDGTGENVRRLQEIKDLVNKDWSIYEQIWHEANQMGRYRLRKEKRAWELNGALENAATAQQALEAKHRGHSIHHVFGRRKKKLKQAEQPRASAMNQPHSAQDAPDPMPEDPRESTLPTQDIPERSEEDRKFSAPEMPGDYLANSAGAGGTRATENEAVEDATSETTAVAGSDDDEHKLKSTGQQDQGGETLVKKQHSLVPRMGSSPALVGV